jgi:single-strand DNA-binding protein
MNSWNFTGNLGRDAEVRFTPAGDPITNFSVAVKAGYGKNEVTSWVTCSIFGKRGEAVASYLKKGNQVGVSGEGLLRTWDKDGTKQSSLECRVNDVTLLGSKDASTSSASQKDAPPNETYMGKSEKEFEDDIPF